MQIFSDDFETIHYCYFCSSPELQAIISYNSTKQKHVNYLKIVASTSNFLRVLMLGSF